jgi:hypothetical protein
MGGTMGTGLQMSGRPDINSIRVILASFALKKGAAESLTK